ncbi:probable Protein SLY1 [Saccharomycodes ludwigii]|uniref:Probable Protein SLY1 n=1 Tax=Saccharomycodes ludwigii TaxID=36035 RepID=A0A376BBX3_9ASCO|nr:probable Protein SLY1 [Saccharomycodes ludwigii]
MENDSLREKQVSVIEKLLMFNEDPKNIQHDLTSDFNNNELVWKVLILDRKSTGIISSVLRVNDLLKKGVTVHTSIKQSRTPLPDVPAIYFVQPTKENIDIIIQDLSNDMYSFFYINFTSSISRDLLEYFAKEVAFKGKCDKIKQIFDQYLDFIVTEPELFSLEIDNAYYQLNSTTSSEEQIINLCDEIAKGLLNAIMTIDSIPIIRAQKGGAAEIVAQKLDSRLRDYVLNTKNSGDLLPSSQSLERTVLILLDRNIDLKSMLSHSLFYECLVFDVFTMARNTITFQYHKENEAAPVKMKVDIEPKDFFWRDNCYLPFPDAVENVENELNKYKQEAEEVTKKTGVTNLNDLDPNSANDTINIQEAVNKLPKLTAKKQIIDSHFKILASLIPELSSKSLDTFYEIEQEDVDQLKTRQRFLEVLKDDKKTNLENKLRTFGIMYLSSKEPLPKTFVTQVEEYFQNQDYDCSPLKYIYKLRKMMDLSNISLLQNKSLGNEYNGHGDNNYNNNNSTNGSTGSELFSGLSKKLYGLAGDKIQGGVGSLVSRVSNLLTERKTIPITNIVEAIMDPLNSSNNNLQTTDSYLYYDPRILRGDLTRPPKRQSYNKSMVFVVGGGNYIEYQNLQQWAHGNSEQVNKKKVIYGSTSISKPTVFLKEISKLA